ncbi:hypothetical protein CPB83DRAFT_911110 [Crepidotus variabilis]|uniref:Uncharacterized protein n=1 Tax=Crepidotus variabilis TaxID=179855 RepID=A0A9P6E588_9AGAR|nr:hypothetical protein CPB83DRAFT_911110 [Crepidotus variabilis]
MATSDVPTSPTLRLILLAAVCLSLSSTVVLVKTSLNTLSSSKIEPFNYYFAVYPKDTKQHTFAGDDIPELWPFKVNKALMQIEESVHYAFNNTESDAEWLTLKHSQQGLFRIDEAKHTVVPPFIHQLHCLHLIRELFLQKPSAFELKGHDQHCLNTLRQWAQCRSDLTLERAGVDLEERDFETDRAGGIHVCRDWTQILEEGDRNWDDWATFWHENHLEQYLNQPSFGR